MIAADQKRKHCNNPNVPHYLTSPFSHSGYTNVQRKRPQQSGYTVAKYADIFVPLALGLLGFHQVT